MMRQVQKNYLDTFSSFVFLTQFNFTDNYHINNDVNQVMDKFCLKSKLNSTPMNSRFEW